MNRYRLAAFALTLAVVTGLACKPAGPVSQAPPGHAGQGQVETARRGAPPVTQAPAENGRSQALTANARLLAGLPVEGPAAGLAAGPATGPAMGEAPWAAIQKSPAWTAHARTLGALWKSHEQARLSRVRRWAEGHLGPVRTASGTVFYPFGGPDALYVTSFFPDAPSYVLVGLEPVGQAPDLASMAPAELDGSLKEMEVYITPILQISFFRTDDMEVELAEKGTVPILMTFLAGTGHRILDVRPVAPAADGTSVETGGPGGGRGVCITFAKGEGAPVQRLYYFSQDLSNAGLKGASGFMAFLRRMDRPVTFLKAASYLMHRNTFSVIRAFILEHAPAVLEDDSGIPLRSFGAKEWDLKFFGVYTAPIRRFKDFKQKDLLEAYHGAGAAGPLDFGIGYQHHAGDSNLLLAARRTR